MLRRSWESTCLAAKAGKHMTGANAQRHILRTKEKIMTIEYLKRGKPEAGEGLTLGFGPGSPRKRSTTAWPHAGIATFDRILSGTRAKSGVWTSIHSLSALTLDQSGSASLLWQPT